MAPHRPWRPQMTPIEQRQGLIFFGLYLLVFPFLLPLILRTLDNRFALYFTAAESSAVYYLIIAAALFAVFWSFLRHGFHLLLDWLPENLFAILVGGVGTAVLTFVALRIPLPVDNPILTDYPMQYLLSPGATVAIVVFLRPLVEEILFRGLLFGGLRTVSRPVAYLVTVPLFALCSVWQFVFPDGGAAYLLLAVHHLPLSAALTWCYDNGGSIWSPIVLRMICSAAALRLMLP